MVCDGVESGAGKSTLLKLFNGTLSADHGTVFYDETDIEAVDTVRLRQEVMLVNLESLSF
ncbi:MAG: ATP-binding cassette domain-containing protein [Eubacterium sp.]